MNIFIKLFTNFIFLTTIVFSSNIYAITAADIENANPQGQTVEFWVQYSDERLDAVKARASRFEHLPAACLQQPRRQLVKL